MSEANAVSPVQKRITRQEIFDKVAPALLAQNKKSRRDSGFDGTLNGQCVYKSDDNSRCAIGHLIPDGHNGLWCLGDLFELLDSYKDLYPILGFNGMSCMDSDDQHDQTHIVFLNDLQKIHDYKPVIEWRARLIDLASAWNLDSSCIEGLSVA